jgi:hypothetical protein
LLSGLYLESLGKSKEISTPVQKQKAKIERTEARSLKEASERT